MPRPRTARVLVVGSVNHDTYAHVAALPMPGQSVLASSAFAGLGGKGANQAVAAVLAGANVRLVAAVGDDPAGRDALDELDRRGIDVSGVRAVPGAPTGAAYIAVDRAGENAIVVVTGANSLLAPDDVAATPMDDVQVVVTQGELSPPTIAAAAALAARAEARFVLNLVPFRSLPREVLDRADPLVVSEREAADLLGSPAPETLDEARAAAARLLALGSRSVVVRLGAQGAIGADGAGVWHQCVTPAAIEPVDTTGSCDALTGVLAARLAQRDDLRAALAYGVVAASISVTRPGTTATYPTAVEIAAAVDLSPGRA